MPMKFRAHDTFFIRKGWLSKGMRCVAKKPDVFIAHDENPMDVLGIGANMVKALRYWLQTIGLTEEPNKGKRIQSFTDLGKLIYEHDTYIEELGTLYLLQYCLASQKEEATAWYFFFNEFSMSEFSREDFVAALQKYIKMEDTETDYAIRSLNDDFQCIINTYAERVYRELVEFYNKSEDEVRTRLQDTINEIFKQIYEGGLALTIDDKYHISVYADDYHGNVETSTAQSISVIFAFITGIIKMARDNRNATNEDDKLLSSEPYPLVMDAPLSAFDKRRIKTVCTALPEVAEQVVIFIKDTDGDIAEEHMGDRIGSRHRFEKLNEFETKLV